MKTKQNKNWILRITSIVLMFTLISTCLMSSTLAKYISRAAGIDSARVAKWGVTVTADAKGSAFKTKYETSTSDVMDTQGEDIVLSVVSTSTAAVIAPGTDGEFNFSINGSPEVAVGVAIKDNGTKLSNNWKAPTSETDLTLKDYRPVYWTLYQNGDVLAEGADLAEVFLAFTELSGNYQANNNLSTIFGDFCLKWEWTFSVNETQDMQDTYLGNLAVAPTIDLNFDVTVTQID